MAMNIKNAEASRLAHRIAELTGETVTGAVTESLRERLTRLEAAGEPLAARILAIGRDCAARLPDHIRSVDHEGLLYGPDGLPR